MANVVVRTAVQLLSAGALVLAAAGVWVLVTENAAERRARAFCSRLHVGMPVQTLEAQALAAGASPRQSRWIRPALDHPRLAVTFTGAFPMSRHICSIEGAPTLLSAGYVYLD